MSNGDDPGGTAGAAAKISGKIAELDDWRGETLAEIREVVTSADPDVVEKWQYRGVPVWHHHGVICTGETYHDHVKMTFSRGASLNDPDQLFNGTTGGNTWRAIDFFEGDQVRRTALEAMIKRAITANTQD